MPGDSKRLRVVHRFDRSMDIEARHAPRLDHWLSEHYDLRVATDDEQRAGVDRIATDDFGARTTLDYKCDERAHITGNLFIETVSNSRTRRPGWALTSSADWLVYFAVPDLVWMFLMRHIRSAMPTWRRCCHERAAANAGYSTFGLCVPFRLARQRVEYVADLNHGDGPVLQSRQEYAED